MDSKLIELLTSTGRNPNDYDFDEASSTFVKRKAPVDVQPVVQSAPVTDKPQPISAPAAFGGSALAEVVPMIGATLTGMGTGAVAGAAGLNPFTVALGALGGGMYGAHKYSEAQSALLPEETNKWLAEAARQQRVASFAGRLVPSAATFGFNPSRALTAVKDVPGALEGSLSAANKANLLNVGIGTAGGAAGVAMRHASDPEAKYDWEDVANVIAGAGFNKPRAWAARVGLHDSGEPQTRESVASQYLRELQNQRVPKAAAVEPTQTINTVEPGDAISEVRPRSLREEELTSRLDAMRLAVEEQKLANQIKAAELKSQRRAEKEAGKYKAELAKEQEKAAELHKANLEAQVTAEEVAKTTPKDVIETLGEQVVLPKSTLPLTKEIPPPTVASEGGEVLKTPIGEGPEQKVPLATTPLEEVMRKRALGQETKKRYQHDPDTQYVDKATGEVYDKEYKLPVDVANQLRARKIGPSITNKPLFVKGRAQAANEQGVVLEQDTSLTTRGETDVAPIEQGHGLEDINAKVNPQRASLDTIDHELIHGMWARLKKLGTPSEKRMVENLEKTVGEEAGVQRAGVEVLNEVLSQNRQARTLFRDTLRAFKVRFGNPSPQELSALLARKHLYQGDLASRFPDAAVKIAKNISAKSRRAQEDNAELDATYIGDMGDESTGILKLYNLKKDITDESGRVIRPKNSTVTQETLDKHGLRYQPEVQQELDYATIKKEDEGSIQQERIDTNQGRTNEEASVGDKLPVATKESEVKRSFRNIFDSSDTDPRRGSSRRYQEDAPDADWPVLPVSKRLPWSSQNDKVRALNPKAGNSLDSFHNDKQDLIGGWVNKPLDELSQYKVDDIAETISAMREAYRSGDTTLDTLTPLQQEIQAKLPFYHIREVQIEEGLPTQFREGSLTESYVPDIFSQESRYTLNNKQGTPEREAIYKDLVDYYTETFKAKGVKENPVEFVNNLLSGVKGNPIFGVEFKALRDSAGYGLPESVREKNPLRIIESYGRRAATDISYWKNLQKNPETRALLDLPDINGHKTHIEGTTPLTGPDVEGAMKYVTGDLATHTPLDDTVRTLGRTVNSAIMGVGTGVANITTIPSGIAPYLTSMGDAGAYLSGLTKFRENITKSLHANSRNKRLDDYQWGVVTNPSPMLNAFNKLSQVLRVGQGREVLEQAGRIYAHGVGEYLVKANINRALAGDAQAKKWLEHTVQVRGMNEIENFNEETVAKLARRFVEKIEGSYSAKGLPVEVDAGPLAPYLALSKWGIEKMNNFHKDVVTPAVQENNYLPLILATGGAYLTGEAIRQIAEWFNNKKSATPSLKEVEAANETSKEIGGKELDNINLKRTQAVLGTLQLGSFAGFAGDMIKGASDITQGRMPRGISYPLMDFASDNIAKHLKDASEAIESGEDKVDVALGFMQQVAKHSLQNYRYWYNNMDAEGKKTAEKQDKYRDLRVFNELEGKPTGSPVSPNMMLKKEEREFKNTQDIEEAVEKLPSLINRAFERAGNDPYKLIKEIKGLKANSYQTMPNFENDPIGFASYLLFLKKSQGDEAASKRLEDYIRQTTVNKAKAALIP